MLVFVLLYFDILVGKLSGVDLYVMFVVVYCGCKYVRVVEPGAGGKLEAQALNDTNTLELSVYANEARHQAVLVARLDNLGKGASGAAVQNLELMLGLNGSG